MIHLYIFAENIIHVNARRWNLSIIYYFLIVYTLQLRRKECVQSAQCQIHEFLQALELLTTDT